MGPKTIKNVSNILPKLAYKTVLQVGSILDPTWLHFGRVLAPKLEPSWHQNTLKIDPRTYEKTDRLLNRLRTDFLWILVNFGLQDGVKFSCIWRHLSSLEGVFVGSWGIMGPKTLQELIFSWFLIDFGWVVGGSCAPRATQNPIFESPDAPRFSIFHTLGALRFWAILQ